MSPSQVVSLDYSRTVIAKMRDKHGDSVGTFVEGDMTAAGNTLPEGTIDVVVDKCAVWTR